MTRKNKILSNDSVVGPKLKEAQDDHIAGRYKIAEQKYRKILAKYPRLIQAKIGLAVSLCALGRTKEAWELAEPLLNFESYKAQAIDVGNLSWVARQCGKFVEAATFSERTVELNPDYALGWLNLSATYRDLRRLTESEAAARKAITLQPDYHGGHLNLGNVFLDRGLHAQAEESMRKARDCKPEEAHNWNNLFFCMVNNVARSAEDIYIEAVKFGEQFVPQNIKNKKFPLPVPVKRLNIGFVSGDFRAHAVSYFLDPLLARLNREAFKLFLYSTTISPDHVTPQIRRYADEWIDAFPLSSDELCSKIEKDRIDILIDLSSHTSANRLMVFAQKPAPVQVTWLGFPCSTGLSTVDWRITDGTADTSEADGHYVEKLWRLPSIFCCYRPCVKTPSRRYHLAYETNTTPAVKNGYITFGSCNNPSKITDDALQAWGSVLSSVPNSRMLIEGKGFDDEIAKNSFIERCTSAGIAQDRLDLIPLDNSKQYLTYHQIDVVLDTFPMTGGTTTFDALWMGVPVVTLTGTEFRNRISTTILNAANHNKWANVDVKSYITCAVNLASNVNTLNRIRSRLRREFEKSPAMDASLFAQDFGAALQGMWQKYCESLGIGSSEITHFSPVVAEPLIYLGNQKTITLPEGIQRADEALVDGDLVEAKKWCSYVLWEEPRHPEALAIIARIARIQGNWAEFYGFISHAADADPKNERLYYEMLEMACEHGERETALGILKVLIQRIPERTAVWQEFQQIVLEPTNQAIVWIAALNQIAVSIDEVVSNVVATVQQQAHALTQRGNALILSSRTGEAIPLIQQALKLDPEHAAGWVAMAAILVKLECYVAAIDAAKNALKFDPSDASAHNNLALALKGVGDLPATIELLEKAHEMNPQNKNFAANFLLNMSYSDDFSAQQIKILAELVVKNWYPSEKIPAPEEATRPITSKIRIGFVTPDVNSHPIMYCLAPVLTHYDRNCFEVVLYHTRSFADEVTQWVKYHTTYYSVAGLSGEELARKIKSDQIDVLFDLAGFTAGHALDVFAYRAAPVQVSWLGYPGTTGVTEMDWRLTDAMIDPQETEANYVEKLWRLPVVHCPYRPLISAHHKRWLSEYQVRPTPAVENGYVTFGCCNNLVKASPRILKLWKRVLDAVPNSRLLVESRGVEDSFTLDRLKQRFESYGFNSSDLIWVSRRHAPQYSTYHQIDIALDTSPYTGGITTFDTLWMGVPLITLIGEDARSRLSASSLNAAGLNDWIAATENEYIEIAKRLASNAVDLNRIRLGLRRKIENSAFMNESAFTRDFEDAIIGMLQHKNVPIQLSLERENKLNVIFSDGCSYSLDEAYQKSRACLTMRNYDSLVDWAEVILSSKAGDVKALDWLAIAAYENKQHDDAIAYASQTIDIDPTELRYCRLLKWLLAMANIQLANIVVTQLQRRFPTSASSYQEIAIYLQKQQMPPPELWNHLGCNER